MSRYDFISEEESELRSYFIGFWIADGWMDTTLRQVRVSSIDEQIIRDLAKAIGYTNKIYEQKNRKFGSKELSGTTQYSISLNSIFVTHYLIKMGYDRLKTGNEFLPQSVLFRHFMRGLSDGDGSFFIHKDKGNKRLGWQLSSASGTFLQDILDKLRSESVVGSRSSVRADRSLYRICLAHHDSLRLADWMYLDATIKLERKYLVYVGGQKLAVDPRGKQWTKAEKQMLREGHDLPWRSKSSVATMRWRLGLSSKDPHTFTSHLLQPSSQPL